MHTLNRPTLGFGAAYFRLSLFIMVFLHMRAMRQ